MPPGTRARPHRDLVRGGRVRTAAARPWPGALAAGTAGALGGLAGAALVGQLPVLGSLPAGALLGVSGAVALLPLALRQWQMALGVFLTWLMLEDLVRKLAGNDLRVYFVKDVIYVLVLAGLAQAGRGAWRRATGSSRLWFYALVVWAGVMSIPSAFEDWRLPLVGLRLDFSYAPLVMAGFLIAREPGSLRRWLRGLTLLAGAASAVGIAQAVLGPEFLSPQLPTPGLGHLVLIRGLPESGPVYRPTGTFVDPGRFAWMALVGLAISLAAFALGGRERVAVVAGVLAAAGAVWVSGGRAVFVAGAFLVAIAAVGVPYAPRRPALRRRVAVAASAVAAVALLAGLFPQLFSTRLAWYRETLDPRSLQNEWASRWHAYGGDTLRGIAIGGLLGQGTGRESLGKQYLYGAEARSPAGLSQVEGGYASVAVEWGVVGLALWVGWSLAWVRRQWRMVQAARGTPLASAGLVLFGWMLSFLFFGFFVGFQVFQNYLANAYFWLLSGVLFALPLAAEAQRDQA